MGRSAAQRCEQTAIVAVAVGMLTTMVKQQRHHVAVYSTLANPERVELVPYTYDTGAYETLVQLFSFFQECLYYTD
jgi:hypothetical protein